MRRYRAEYIRDIISGGFQDPEIPDWEDADYTQDNPIQGGSQQDNELQEIEAELNFIVQDLNDEFYGGYQSATTLSEELQRIQSEYKNTPVPRVNGMVEPLEKYSKNGKYSKTGKHSKTGKFESQENIDVELDNSSDVELDNSADAVDFADIELDNSNDAVSDDAVSNGTEMDKDSGDFVFEQDVEFENAIFGGVPYDDPFVVDL